MMSEHTEQTKDRRADECPQCGAHVSAFGARGIGARGEGQPLPEGTEQSTTCPN